MSETPQGDLLLSICIPTYNRAPLLQRCLESVLPQTRNRAVEVVVLDNASPDQTEATVRAWHADYPALRYLRNDTNLGYAGNQARCLREASGRYTAILCDDDAYRADALGVLLPVLAAREFRFVAMNYYPFRSDPAVPAGPPLAPSDDVCAEDAYQIWDHPSVGHFSGLVFNSRLARTALDAAIDHQPLESYERFRGVLADVAVRCMRASTLPGYFVGTPIVAAGIPPTIDYDGLRHVCMDYYERYLALHALGLLTDENLKVRRHHVLGWLPGQILRSGGFLDATQLADVRRQLDDWLGHEPQYQRRAVPLLAMLRSRIVRACLRQGIRMARRIKSAPHHGS